MSKSEATRALRGMFGARSRFREVHEIQAFDDEGRLIVAVPSDFEDPFAALLGLAIQTELRKEQPGSGPFTEASQAVGLFKPEST